MLPEGWRIVSVGEIARVVTGSTPDTTQVNNFGGDIPFVTPGDLGRTKLISSSARTLTEQGFHASRHVPAGSTLFTCIGSSIGKLGMAGRTLATNQQINAVIPNEGVFPDYLYYGLECRSIEIAQLAGMQAIPIISKSQFEQESLLLPESHAEQRVIATILSTWDRAIELTEKLIAAKQQRKQVLMQQLLTGRKRLPGFGVPWRTCDLREVASNSHTRHGGGEHTRQVYSVTNSVGMIPMAEDVIGESIERYKIVSPREFAYNPMRINVGSIAMWQGTEEVLVSPDYVVFRCGPDLDADFLNHFRQTHYWDQFVNRAGGGSVRVRIYFDDLAELPLKLPPLDEQKAIAAVLNTQDREVELLRQKLDALRRQKKGLMQQLLTGKVRVKVPAEAPEV